MVCTDLSESTGIRFCEARNHFEGHAAKDAVCEASGLLRTIAVSLTKVANDIRWLASGPRCGIGEIRIPETQPGSSIMPGKVNPVMCETVIQVSAQVIANDIATMLACRDSVFELNVMMPLMTHNFLESVRLLTAAVGTFTERCVRGIEADEKRCNELVEQSLAMVTSLAPEIGYDKAADLAKEAYKTNKTVRQLCLEKGVIDAAKLAKLLDPTTMTEPH